MGTNFYRRTIISLDKKEEAKKLIDKNDIDGCINLLNTYRDDVHICKRSFGWKVCFDHNWGEYYKPNRDSLDKFLREDGTEVVDEYGNTYSVDEFWDSIDRWNNEPNNKWTAKTYEEFEKSKDPNWTTYNDFFNREKCYKVFGIECDEDDFKCDGLRFAVYSNFT